MCDCIEKNKAGVLAHLQKKHTGKMEIVGPVSLDNAGISITGGKAHTVTFDEYTTTAFPLKKDGSRGKAKVLTVPFAHSYCSHCGEKYPTE